MSSELEELHKHKVSLVDEREVWRFRTSSHITLVAASMFAIVISLGSPEKDNVWSIAFFLVGLICGSLCILFGCIAIQRHRHACDNALRKISERIKTIELYKDAPSETAYSISIHVSKYYEYCAILSLILFCTSVLSLCTYAIIVNV